MSHLNKLAMRDVLSTDAVGIVNHLRPDDRREMIALDPAMPENMCIDRSVAVSEWSQTVVEIATGRPVAIFGVAKNPGCDLWHPWMHATTLIMDHRFEFLRRCRTVVNTLMEFYSPMFNVVDARNNLHLKWLHWCGFKFYPSPVYFSGVPFIPFRRTD